MYETPQKTNDLEGTPASAREAARPDRIDAPTG